MPLPSVPSNYPGSPQARARTVHSQTIHGHSHRLRAAAVQADRTRKASRDLDHLVPLCARSEVSTTTPGAGTEPGAVVLIDTHYQSVFPLRQILDTIFGSHDIPSRMCPPKSKLQPRCPITRCIPAAIFRKFADKVLDIT